MVAYGVLFMTITWVLITNGSQAKILHASIDPEEARLIREFIHPRTAKKDFDTSVDLEHSFEKKKPLKPAIDYSPGVEAYERLVFAKEMAAYLEKALDLHEFDSLILVASREMLGELRKALDKTVTKAVSHELDKDLLTLGLSNIELLKKIRDDLDLVHL